MVLFIKFCVVEDKKQYVMFSSKENMVFSNMVFSNHVPS